MYTRLIRELLYASLHNFYCLCSTRLHLRRKRGRLQKDRSFTAFCFSSHRRHFHLRFASLIRYLSHAGHRALCYTFHQLRSSLRN